MDKSLRNYFVSFDTLALHPLTIGNKIFTKVIERDRTFIVSKKPIHIVTRSCSYYGSNLARAMHTSHHVLGKLHKVPIMLANAYGVPFIFIPTMSPTSDQNVWISYHAVQNFKKDGLNTSMLLENGEILNLSISTSTFYRQYSLARMIEIDFLKNYKRMDRSTYLFPAEELKKVQESEETEYKQIDDSNKEPDESGEDN